MTQPRHTRRRVLTVPPGRPFLPTVANALVDGTLVDGFAFDGDPMTLARATIYVPTRRAARELRSAFMDALGASSVLLPVIRPLGEFDDEAAFFSGGGDALNVAPAIDPLERQIALGTLVARWTDAMTDQLYALYGEERLTTPVSTADAFWMAADLGALIDQLETEDLAFSKIEAAADADVSQWWQVTLAFLQIVKTGWPAYLAERNLLDPAAHRNAMLRAEARRLAQSPPEGPVIAAGSTGTIPATAELIKVIAELPNGAAILPGYDTSMEKPTRDLLDDETDIASVVGHPQYGMRKLLRTIGIAHEDVETLGGNADATRTGRGRWVAAALAPASDTAHWLALRSQMTDSAFDDVGILHAPNERAEALAIACALRASLLTEGRTAALVTPDRNLARRVSAELARFGIAANDSGGTAFSLTPQGTLLALMLDLASGEADPAALLALLKHPLVRFGAPDAIHRHAVHWLEMMVLRGGAGRIHLANFTRFAEIALARWSDEARRRPDWFEKVASTDFEAVSALARRIEAGFGPLAALDRTTLAEAGRQTVRCLEAIAGDDGGDPGALYEGDAGQALADFLYRMLENTVPLELTLAQWPDIIGALTAALAVKPAHGGHPRLHIWGTLEARLQTVDLLVLGGLNEGTWPASSQNDAFLTRQMKTRVGLDPPERRVGLAAHDFQMALGQAQVLLTRAAREGGTPSVASRWLQRLETLAGAEARERMHASGDAYAKMADAIDAPIQAPAATRPAPAPPVTARPNRLSVTEVETLRRDPYAFYARKVLRLAPLEPLVRDPDFADRGALIHAVMEAAARAEIDFAASDAQARLGRIARTVFDEAELPPEIDALWWARITAAIPRIAAWEAERQPRISRRLAEPAARPTMIGASGVELTGRADRIDPRHDGGADIIDFKTGAVPSIRQVQSLLAPQLPLEAALMMRGAFGDMAKAQPGELIYVRLGARGEVEARIVSGGKGKDAPTLAGSAWQKLAELIEHYGDERNGYLSRVMPMRQAALDGDYDHLARTREWMIGGDDG